MKVKNKKEIGLIIRFDKNEPNEIRDNKILAEYLLALIKIHNARNPDKQINISV